MNNLSLSDDNFKCKCSWKGRSITQLKAHIKKLHKNVSVEWICGVCGIKGTSYKVLYNHQREHVRLGIVVSVIVEVVEQAHQNDIQISGNEDSASVPEEVCENNWEDIAGEEVAEDVAAGDKLKNKLVELAIVLSTKHKVNEDALDFMFQSLQKIQEELLGRHEELFPFKEVRTSYRRNKLLLQQAGVVKPVRVDVGIVRKRRPDGIVKFECIQAYIVPIQDTLRFAMKNPHFLASIRSEINQKTDGVWNINVGMSIDDVELANPLGQAKVRHKQTVCSFEIGNLPSSLRSRDESKHLLFLSNSTAFKKKQRADMKLFEDLKKALEESKDGLKLLEGSDDLFRINLDHVTADAEAMCSVLKLKMTGAKTKRPCWGCHIHHDDMPWVFDIRSIEQRTLADHKEKCLKVLDPRIRNSVRQKLSQETGIKEAAAITELEGFTFEKMCFDGMHCVLEGGILELGIVDFLRELINEQKSMTWEQANDRIVRWKYRLKRGDVSPPSLPKRILFGKSLGYKAQTCWTLAENLLFIFEDQAEAMKPHFKHFGRCLRICQVILHAPVTSAVNIEILRVQLMHFHVVRLSLYWWAKFTPKCHFSLHFPEQIRRHGPSRYTSCLQFERHYKTVKSKRLSCWKNPSKTLANFHQQWQVRALCEVKGGQWTSRKLDRELKYLKRVDLSDLPADVVAFVKDECVGAKVFQKAEYGMKMYKTGDFMDRSDLNEYQPDFFRIECFVLWQLQRLIVVTFFKPQKFINICASFQCEAGEIGLVNFSDIEHKYCLPAFLVRSQWFVNRKYAAAIENFIDTEDAEAPEATMDPDQGHNSATTVVKKSKIVFHHQPKPKAGNTAQDTNLKADQSSLNESENIENRTSEAFASPGANPPIIPAAVETEDLVELETVNWDDLETGQDTFRFDLLANTQPSDEDAMTDNEDDREQEEDSQSIPEATAGHPRSTPRRRRTQGETRLARATKTKLDFEHTQDDSSNMTDEVSHDDTDESLISVEPSGSQGPVPTGKPIKGSSGIAKNRTPRRRGPLAKIVIMAAKEMAEKLDLVSPKGQHKYKTQTRSVVPDFSPALKKILEDGTKREVAEVADAIAREIVKDMHARDGSGSVKYYNELERGLIYEYPNINNSVFRNAMRREMNEHIPLEQLSEDSQEEDELKPKPGKPRRTFTKKNYLAPLRQRISYLNRTERKVVKRQTLIKKGGQNWDAYGFSQVLPARRLRSEIARAHDSSAMRHQKAIKDLELTPEDSDFADPGLADSFRKTFHLRSDILDLGSRAFVDIMTWYSLFKFKHFLLVEAEVYLGSAGNVQKFFSNVELTWKGIAKLPVEGHMPEGLQSDEAAVYKFKTLIAPLGPSLVNFTTEANKLPGETFAWPYIVHTDLQTIIRYHEIEWLDMAGLKEALGHHILMINVFELTFKSRSQLMLLLESLFFGYTAPLLSKNNIILMNKIMELGRSDDSTQ